VRGWRKRGRRVRRSSSRRWNNDEHVTQLMPYLMHSGI
jgi:hypothetical protein